MRRLFVFLCFVLATVLGCKDVPIDDERNDRRLIAPRGGDSASATAAASLYETLADRLRAIGAVRSVAFTSAPPIGREDAADAATMNVEQALTQQVTTAYLDTVTFAQQIKLAEEQVKTAQEALQLAKQRYKLGLGSVVEVTQSEVAVTAAQTRLADAQYDYKIAEVTLAYATGGASLSAAAPMSSTFEGPAMEYPEASDTLPERKY